MRFVMEIHKSKHIIHNGSAANKIQERKRARSEQVAAWLEDRKGHFAVSWLRYLDK